jgi:prepilin-type processing-associated H-X9-DG protein
MITDINNPAGSAAAQSSIPVMFDAVVGGEGRNYALAKFNHVPGGSNVLYMDGHVEWKRYAPNASTYPVCSEIANALGLAGLVL